MFRRSAALSPLALLCAIIAVLATRAGVRAHRLEAEAILRPFGVVQVESWFETGDVPKSARVESSAPTAGGSRKAGSTIRATSYSHIAI